MKLKKGTPACGLICGAVLAVLGALVMWIGFWKTLVLALLFALGYFLGGVEKKKDFLKGSVNKVIPDKEIKVIDFRSEVLKQQEQSQNTEEPAPAQAKTKE